MASRGVLEGVGRDVYGRELKDLEDLDVYAQELRELRAKFLSVPQRKQHISLCSAFCEKHPGMQGAEARFREWIQAESVSPGGVHGPRAQQIREWQARNSTSIGNRMQA